MLELVGSYFGRLAIEGLLNAVDVGLTTPLFLHDTLLSLLVTNGSHNLLLRDFILLAPLYIIVMVKRR